MVPEHLLCAKHHFENFMWIVLFSPHNNPRGRDYCDTHVKDKKPAPGEAKWPNVTGEGGRNNQARSPGSGTMFLTLTVAPALDEQRLG